MMTEAWRMPRKLNAVEVAFPIMTDQRLGDMMPPYAAIPEEFKSGDTKWSKLFGDWFYFGLKSFKAAPKAGIDLTDAMAVIEAVMRSFEPKHEHKEAAVAYLFSLWLEDATWERADGR